MGYGRWVFCHWRPRSLRLCCSRILSCVTIVSGTFDYRLFGLTIRSEIELPELFPATGDFSPDVTVRKGTLPRSDSVGGRADGDAFLLDVDDGASYRIEGGRDIIVDARAHVPARNVRLFLLGSAFGALLHQRGMLPLHANGVEVGGKAVAFMGETGAGKSTLAAWLHDRGFSLITDDVCVISFDEAGRPLAAPGLPRLRLWLEALQAGGREQAGLERSYVNAAAQMDKFDLAIERTAVATKSVPIAALYLLEKGKRFSVRRLQGIEAAEVLFAHTYRGSYIAIMKRVRFHWELAVKLVRSLPVYAVSREWGLDKMDDQYDRLIDHISREAA